ncbi:MAG: ComEC/Rec2 family competence protein [Alphaproteobacteria bacterium]|nr:ComEC/Rec2 family competence protein [Alphaproteobacteria bacterium]
MTVRTTWSSPDTHLARRRGRLDWLGDTLTAERDRWILWLPVAMGIGIAAYFTLASEPPAVAGPAFIVGAITVVALSFRHFRYLAPALAVAAIMLGFAVAQWRTHDVAAPVIAKELRHRIVTGDIVSVEPRRGRFRITLDVATIAGLGAPETPERVRLTASAGQYGGVRPGQRVSVRATLRPPPAPALPGGFDFRRIAWFQQLGGIGFATGDFLLEAAEPGTDRRPLAAFSDLIQSTRLTVAERVGARLPGVPGAVAAALMVGERGAIPSEVRKAMQQSGLAHLLAISGLHVGLVAGFVFFAIRGGLAAWPALVLRYPVKKWAAAAALSAIAVYLALAGATVPTQRAFIMTGLILVAVILDRRGISMRLIAWAAAVVLLIRPEAFLSVSFQMSFAAVIALVAVYEVVGDKFRRSLGYRGFAYRVAVYLASILLTTVVASLATAPFAVFHFNQFASYSVVANLLAIPIAAFWVMPLIVVSLVLMPFGLEGAVLPMLGAGIELIVGIATWVSSWPGSSLNVAAPPVIGLTLAVVGGLWLCLWQTRWRVAGVLPIAIGLLSITTTQAPNVLVSPDGKLTGVLGHNGVLLVSNGRAQKFVREQWLHRTGANAWRAYPEPGEGKVAGMRCDLVGCVFNDGDRTVAFVQDGRALPEDCRTADILIARFTVPRDCTGPSVVVDRRALVQSGSHAIFWPAEGNRPGFVVRKSEPGTDRRLWLRRPPVQ